MNEHLEQFLDALFMIDENPKSQRRWRMLISTIILFFAFHVAWSCGYIPGLMGFAKASEVEQARNDIYGIKVQLLEKDIIDTRRQQCAAQNKQFFTERLQQLLRAYYDIVKSGYPLPDCRDF